jgi:hypothetical protein
MTLKAKFVIYPMILAFVLATVIVFFVLNISIMNEILISAAVCSILLFILMFIGLFHGIKLVYQKSGISENIDKIDLTNIDPSVLDIPAFEIDDNPIFAILLWIVITIFASGLLFILLNFIWGLVFIIFGIIYWIIYRALRLMLKKSAVCKGNTLQSMKFSAIYTAAYTSWIFIVIEISKYLRH